MRIATWTFVVGCVLSAAACQDGTRRSAPPVYEPVGEDLRLRGERGEELVVATPSEVTISRGGTAAIEVGIGRSNFRDAVTVSLTRLPDGVTVDRPVQRVETTSATFVLRAASDADLVRGQAVEVGVEGPDGMRGTQHVRLTVRE